MDGRRIRARNLLRQHLHIRRPPQLGALSARDGMKGRTWRERPFIYELLNEAPFKSESRIGAPSASELPLSVNGEGVGGWGPPL